MHQTSATPQNRFSRYLFQGWVILSFSFGSAGVLADWARVGDEQGTSLNYFVDMQSVKQTGPMSIYRQVTVLIQGPALKSQSLGSTISLNEYDCMTGKLRVLQTTGFTQPWGNGDKLPLSSSPSKANDWQVLPETPLGQQTLNMLCPSGKDD